MEASHIRELQEAYQNVYYTEETFFSDLVDICTEYFFESFEDSSYFVEELHQQDLLDEFLIDFAKELGVDISYYLEEARGGAALRGIINALSSSGRSRAGLSAASAMGKAGQTIKGSAASTAIRSARAARRSSAPATGQPGKYLTMLQSKRAARGLPSAGGTTASSPKAVAQRELSAGWQRDAAAKKAAQQVVSQAATVAQGFMKSLKQGAARDRLATAAAGTRGTGINIGQPGATRLQLPAAGGTSASAKAPQMPKIDMPTTSPTSKKGSKMGDPWNWFPKKPGKQYGIPKEGPSSRIPNRTLAPAGGTSQRPALPPASSSAITSTPATTSSSRNTSYRGIGGGQKYDVTGQSFRATGSGGDARTQRLASQSAPSSSLRSTTSSLKSSDRSSRRDLYTAAGLGGVGVGFGGGIANNQEEERRRREEERKRKESMTAESYEYFEILANVLVNEGYVKDYDGAVNMINTLDDDGLDTLVGRILKND